MFDENQQAERSNSFEVPAEENLELDEVSLADEPHEVTNDRTRITDQASGRDIERTRSNTLTESQVIASVQDAQVQETNLTPVEGNVSSSPRTRATTAEVQVVTTSSGRVTSDQGELRGEFQSPSRSIISQLTFVSVLSFVSWMSAKWTSMIRFWNGLGSISTELIHIFNVVGIERNQDVKKIVEDLGLTSISELAIIDNTEWMLVCQDMGMSLKKAERLWIGLKAFKDFYSQKSRELSIAGTPFSATSYNRIIHTQLLDNIVLNRLGESPKDLFSQLNIHESIENISPVQSAEDFPVPESKKPNRRNEVTPPILKQKPKSVLKSSSPLKSDEDLSEVKDEAEKYPPLPGEMDGLLEKETTVKVASPIVDLDKDDTIPPIETAIPLEERPVTKIPDTSIRKDGSVSVHDIDDPRVQSVLRASPGLPVAVAVRIVSALSPAPSEVPSTAPPKSPSSTPTTELPSSSPPKSSKSPSKGVSWYDLSEKDDDDNSVNSIGKEGSESESSSDSFDSDEDSEDEHVSVGSFRLSDVSHMKLPQLPIGKSDYETFIRQLMNRLAMTGADSLVHLDKDLRLMKPKHRKVSKNGKVEKKSKFKKRKAKWIRCNKTILLILKEMAHNAKHYLSKDLQAFKCGVKAFDFLVESMDPISVDPTNENADSFEKFQKIELVSVAKGAFQKFYSLFQYRLSELIEGEGVTFTEEYQKSLLIGKLKHKEYAPMRLPQATRVPLEKYVKELRQFAVLIEKSQPKDSRNTSINNTNTTKTEDGEIKLIDTISGLKIDKDGKASKEDFGNLNDEKRQSFLQKRREMIKDPKIGFKKHPNFESSNTGGGGSNKNVNSNNAPNYAKMQRTLTGKINKLKQELGEKNDGNSNSKSKEKEALIQSVNSASMPDEQRKKIVAYMEKHIKAMRTVEYNAALVKRANLLETSDESNPTIIDGGADTGMNGSAYVFLEHTSRKANVIGYDADMVKKGLPIGTSVTATKDSNGKTVILLQNEQIDHSSQPNSMLAPNQVRHYGIDLDDCPSCFEIDGRPGRMSMKTEDFEIPFEFEKGLIFLKTWRPSKIELQTCPVIMITSDAEWNPESLQGSIPQSWDPNSSLEDRKIVNSQVHNIMAHRVSTGVGIHSLSTRRTINHVRPAPQANDVSDNDSMPDLVRRTDDSVSSGDDDSSLSLTNEFDSLASEDISDDFYEESGSNNSDISYIFDFHDIDSSSSGGLQESSSFEKGISFAGNSMTRHVLNNLNLNEIHSDANAEEFVKVNLDELQEYIDDIVSTRQIQASRTRIADHDWETMRRRFAWLPLDIIKKTFEVTTQLAKVDVRLPLRRHYKSRFPQANVTRLRETFSTDTFFSSTTGINGETMVQLFVGNKSQLVVPYGMKQESEGPTKLEEFIRDWGAPDRIFRDNSKMQNSAAWKKIERIYQIKQATCEPDNQHQNPAERKIQTVKNGVNRIMDRTMTPKFAWFECLEYFCAILNVSATPSIGDKTPLEVSLGYTADISPYIAYEWWEPVYYLDYEDPSFPQSREKIGRFCGPVPNCGDMLTFKIYVKETHKIIHRSVLRSAKDDKGQPNLRAANPNYSVEDDNGSNISDIDYTEELHAISNDNADIPIDVVDSERKMQDNIISLNDLVKHASDNGVSLEQHIPDPKELMSFTFPMEHEGLMQRAVVKELPPDKSQATIELTDGSRHLIDYHLLIEKFNTPEEDGNQIFTFSDIGGHKSIKGVWHVLVHWDGHDYKPTWEPLSIMKDADPITLAMYAKKKGLTSKKGWKWAKRIKVDGTKLIRQARRIYKVKKQFAAVKYKFGVQVPSTGAQAMALDKENGDHLWEEAITKEINQLLDLETFNILERGEKAPEDHTFVSLIIVFDVKHDGRRKARIVAGGHMTDTNTEDVYTSLVGQDGVRMVTYIADANNLKLMVGDVGNAYLNGYTREKVWVKFGPEFGPELAGRVGIIHKGLYGLKTSSARWGEHFADTLRTLNWTESKGETDVWMRKKNNKYEYMAVYCDDLIVASENPEQVLEEIKKFYIVRGIGEPDYYLGAEYGRVRGDYTESGVTSSWSAKTYLKNVIDKIEKVVGHLRTYTIPMDPEYHPELDESAMVVGNDISIYRMLIGSAIWAITLGRVDIVYATTMLARYNNGPREGHLDAMKKLFGYLKGHLKGKIVYDTRELDTSKATFLEIDKLNWVRMYGENLEEELPPDMPEPLMREIQITIYFDASFGSDLLTRRSVTGMIVFINGTPVRWYCKKQNTVETATYGSELVAGRIACETAIEYRYKARMMGLKIKGPVLLLGDNMSVIQNCSLPSSMLKKKHNAIAYHRIRECVAMGIVRLGHVGSDNNLSDICTKALHGPKMHSLMKQIHKQPGHMDSGE